MSEELAALENPQVQGLMLAAVMKKLDAMDKKLERKIAFLYVEVAVAEYLKHLKEGVSRRGKSYRNPRSYEYLMDAFEKEFKGRNLCELTGEEVQNFIDRTWRDSKSSTIRQRQQQLHGFFEWSSKYLLKRGSIAFANPTELMEPIAVEVERPDFMPVETMRKMFRRAQMPYKLIFSIMATSGLRVSECVNLRKEDVKGRVITILSPKSGAKQEIAVIPAKVARDLAFYASRRSPGQRIFLITDRSVLNAVHSISEELELEKTLKSHSLRKWCISYWARKNEPGMESFVSRHSHVTLRSRYVAPLTAEEAMEKQKIMEGELYGQ